MSVRAVSLRTIRNMTTAQQEECQFLGWWVCRQGKFEGGDAGALGQGKKKAGATPGALAGSKGRLGSPEQRRPKLFALRDCDEGLRELLLRVFQVHQNGLLSTYLN